MESSITLSRVLKYARDASRQCQYCNGFDLHVCSNALSCTHTILYLISSGQILKMSTGGKRDTV